MSNLKVATIVSQMFMENAYAAHLEGSGECFLVDPGLEPARIIEYLEEQQLVPVAILNTHGHSDHIGGNGAVKRRWPDCTLMIGQGDAPKLTDPMQNLSGPFGMELVSPAADETVTDGGRRTIAGVDLRVLETPGHSAGHVVYVYEGAGPWIVFVGDVIFQGSVGRHDFPDGNLKQLVESIHQKLFTMPDDTILLPGHGPATTVGEEKQENPFVGAPAGYLA